MSASAPYALTPLGRQIVARNLGLAGHAARRLGGDLEDDDAMSEACVALCRAAACHDPARGKLSTILNWAAYSRFGALRKARSRRVVLLQGDDELLFDAPAPQDPDPEAYRELYDALAALARKRPADAAILRRHHLDGVPQKALALEVGCGRKALSMRLAAARRRLRKILEGETT